MSMGLLYQAAMIAGEAYNCAKCGDKRRPNEGHDCWVAEKEATQEHLTPELVDQAWLNQLLLRDDGEAVASPPAYINPSGVRVSFDVQGQGVQD